MIVRPCGVAAPAGHLLMLFTDAVVPDITVHQVLTTRLKIPYPPYHFAVLTNHRAKVRSLIVFNRDILILSYDRFSLFASECAIWQ